MLQTRQTEKDNVMFDFEVFPEWWVVCFRPENDPSATYHISSDEYGYVDKLRKQLLQHRLIGFNCKMYDLLILNAILNDQKPNQVYQVNLDIINNVETCWTKNFNHYNWDWIDLYNDWKFGSLKMYEANSGMSIIESSIPFGKKDLTVEEKKEIIFYCEHDTLATLRLWKKRKDYFGIHEFVSEKYGVPLRKAYQKTMQALTAEAVKARKPTPSDILPEDKTKDIYVLPYIDRILHVNPFSYLLPNDSDERVFMHDGDKFVLGVGGVHSDYDEPIIVESKDGYQLWTIDFTQYYPNMLVKFRLMPRSIDNPGIAIFNSMIKRVEELKEEIKGERDANKAAIMDSQRDKYKVLINALSGAMRSKYSKFYDPSRIITMCAVGQFLLIAICKDIQKFAPGTEILQTNTDGAYLLVPEQYDIQSKMDEICAEIKFKIECSKGKKMIQRDVNNYIWVSESGKVKTKGSWAYNKRAEEKPALFTVCHRAVYNLLLYNIPIEETIRTCRDIMDFVCCAKTGSTYDETVYYDGKIDTPVNNTNRFIASKNIAQGTLFKVKYNENGNQRRDTVANCPANALLLNDDIETYKIEDLNIDYQFYIKFAYDLLPSFHMFN